MISSAGHPCGSITPLRVLHIVLRVFIVAPYMVPSSGRLGRIEMAILIFGYQVCRQRNLVCYNADL